MFLSKVLFSVKGNAILYPFLKALDILFIFLTMNTILEIKTINTKNSIPKNNGVKIKLKNIFITFYIVKAINDMFSCFYL
ncbi:MAG TPA: hypothetical protein DDZ39_03560 [Flavobacteriaceae bacterium]|nr:hypothetical protein [Flavobacteriaceae bacterium]